MNMDKELEAILNSLPNKPRSRLEPYRELIEEFRRQGRTYRDIVAILADKCQVQIAHSTLHAYLKILGDGPNGRQRTRPAVSTQSPDELRQRIAALKSAKPRRKPTVVHLSSMLRNRFG